MMIPTLLKIHSVLTPSERKSTVVLLGLMILAMGLETLGVGAIIPAMALLMQDNFAARYPSVVAWLGNPSQQALIVGGMLSLVGIYLVKVLFLGSLAWWQLRFVYGVQVHLSHRLYALYLRQPYTFHLQRNSAQLMSNVIGEVYQFGSVISQTALLVSEVFVMIGIAVLLIMVEPVGALIVAGVLGAAGWAFHRGTLAHITRWGAARQHHDRLRVQHLQQGLGGVKDVKLLGRENDFLAQYEVHSIKGARVARLQATLQQLPRLWLELLAVAGMALLVLSMVAQGRDVANIVPTLGLFAIAAFRLMPSANRVVVAVQSLRFNVPVIDVLRTELALVTPESSAPSGPAAPLKDVLELNNVSYAYPGAPRPALQGVSLAIRRGESIGFIGASGAGKSTLVDVLLGLLTPDAGQVRLDGEDIQRNLRNWQNQIGYVPQSIFLTDDTLRRNVAFGLADGQIDEQAVQRALRAAQLEGFVAALPDGLQTLVGERGIRLSGGQRQRIGIARALYHDPPVLVLDEATSSLDTTTEHEVMQAVRALHGVKTVIIVAHRLSTVEQCDRLCRLHEGRVVEVGTPGTMIFSQQISSGGDGQTVSAPS